MRLTDNDLFAELRLRGVFELTAVRYVLYESKGGLSIVGAGSTDGQELVSEGLRDATGYSTPADRQGRR